jgi:hypothetical protein
MTCWCAQQGLNQKMGFGGRQARSNSWFRFAGFCRLVHLRKTQAGAGRRSRRILRLSDDKLRHAHPGRKQERCKWLNVRTAKWLYRVPDANLLPGPPRIFSAPNVIFDFRRCFHPYLMKYLAPRGTRPSGKGGSTGMPGTSSGCSCRTVSARGGQPAWKETTQSWPPGESSGA